MEELYKSNEKEVYSAIYYFTSWNEFIQTQPWEHNNIAPLKIIDWRWVKYSNLTKDDYGFDFIFKKYVEGDNKKDGGALTLICQYNFTPEYRDRHNIPRDYHIFKILIQVKNEDEPKIRKFILKHRKKLTDKGEMMKIINIVVALNRFFPKELIEIIISYSN